MQYNLVIVYFVMNLFLVIAHCRWFNSAVIAAGVLQWTCINSMFLVIWVRVQEPTLYKDGVTTNAL
jgi:hypothetical protein